MLTNLMSQTENFDIIPKIQWVYTKYFFNLFMVSKSGCNSRRISKFSISLEKKKTTLPIKHKRNTITRQAYSSRDSSNIRREKITDKIVITLLNHTQLKS